MFGMIQTRGGFDLGAKPNRAPRLRPRWPAWIILRATSRGIVSCRAFHTTPMPPCGDLLDQFEISEITRVGSVGLFRIAER